jgi:RHS repeat-associated protein
MRKFISLVLTLFLVTQTILVPLSVSAQSPSPILHSQNLSSNIYLPSSNFTYDQSGNLTYDSQRTVTWDASGMPSKIELTGKGIEASFIYDGSGSRIAKIVKTNGQLTSTTVYFGNMEKETDYTQSPAKQTITKYYFAGGKRIALRKVQTGQPDELIYLHKDHLSSSTLFTDGSGNKKDALLTYYPYGTTRPNWDLPTEVSLSGTKAGLSSTPSSLPSNHLYTDQIQDPETELYYYNARYYSPQIGLFISPDTAGDGLNPYRYANNNPVMFNDPSGHAAIADGGGGGIEIPPNPNEPAPFGLTVPNVGDELFTIRATEPITMKPCYSEAECRANQEFMIATLIAAGVGVGIGIGIVTMAPVAPQIWLIVTTTGLQILVRVSPYLNRLQTPQAQFGLQAADTATTLGCQGGLPGSCEVNLGVNALQTASGIGIPTTASTSPQTPNGPSNRRWTQPSKYDIDWRHEPDFSPEAGFTQAELLNIAIRLSGRSRGEFVVTDQTNGIPTALLSRGGDNGARARIEIGFDPPHPAGYGPNCPHCNIVMGHPVLGRVNTHILVAPGVITHFRTQPDFLEQYLYGGP